MAEKAIRHARKPLHPKEILDVASKHGVVPQHLHGKTQYKTLAARLSTEIRERAKKSPFYRTAANRFFLRDLATEQYAEYDAPPREKTLHNEHVLTLSDSFLKKEEASGLFLEVDAVIESAGKQEAFRYIIRKDAERRFDVKQIISYAIIFRGGKILTYRRGIFNTVADELRGMRSVGFGGHVSDQDLNLFDSSGYGIVENARRELREELMFDQNEIEQLERPESFKILCGINTNETTEAKKHIAVVIVYFCTRNFVPKKNELSINDLRWTELSVPENDLESFEPWSRAVLLAIYSGELCIEN